MMGSFHHFTYLQFRAVSNIHWKNIPKTLKLRIELDLAFNNALQCQAQGLVF